MRHSEQSISGDQCRGQAQDAGRQSDAAHSGAEPWAVSALPALIAPGPAIAAAEPPNEAEFHPATDPAVEPSSFADDVGVTRGDVILEINKQPVNSEEDFDRVAAALKSGQDVVFLVRQRGTGRQDGTIFLAGTLP